MLLKKYFEHFLSYLCGSALLPWRVRKIIVTFNGSSFGKGTHIEYGLNSRKAKLHVGDNIYVNTHLVVEGEGSVAIGSNVRIGPYCKLITSSHEVTNYASPRIKYLPDYHPINIGKDCWLATSVIVLPGIKIADGCVIGAGAVVTRDTAPNGFYAGVPAKRIRDLRID